MEKSNKLEWISRWRLNSIPGIGCRYQKRLYEQYGSAVQIGELSSNGTLQLDGLGAGAMRALQVGFSDTEASSVGCIPSAEGVEILGFPDEAYPELLRNIPDPPPYFWYKGTEKGLTMPCVSIVGTRRASDYGKRTAHRIAFELASAGICVVSGLAYGIDKSAHEGALDAGGTTIAVLGSGVEEVYPRSHRKLAEGIVQSGCLLSEFPPKAKPDKINFPRRNRIISGLSHVTIVVEAFEKAGALITAHLCIEQKRDLYAVPGRVDDATSAGTNGLLEASAAAVFRSSEQLLEEYRRRGWIDNSTANETAKQPPDLPRTQLEKDVLACLEERSLHIDDIESVLGFPGGALWSALLHLECDGLIRALDGNYYERSRW